MPPVLGAAATVHSAFSYVSKVCSATLINLTELVLPPRSADARATLSWRRTSRSSVPTHSSMAIWDIAVREQDWSYVTGGSVGAGWEEVDGSCRAVLATATRDANRTGKRHISLALAHDLDPVREVIFQ